MKRIILSFILGLTAALPLTHAQTESNGIGLTVKALFLDYLSQNGGEFTDFQSYQSGFELGLIAKITDNLAVAVPLRMAVVQSHEKVEDLHKKLYGIDAMVQYQFYNAEADIVPFLTGGVGYVIEKEGTNNIQVPLGIGLNFKMANRAFFTWQSEFRVSLEDDRNNLHHGLGFTYYLGTREVQQEKEDTDELAPPDEPLDSDGDGVIDDLDLCPQEPGLEDYDGCPDGDEDGLPDYKDLCPEIFGSIELNGCPDTDGDGVSDNEDECPNMVGSPDNNGCPDNDADNDGIPNDLDRCPTVAGPATTGGCPEVDADGDGTPDNLDECPNTPGPRNTLGCPDIDGDGVPDAQDRCPSSPGSALNNGCPDANQDTDGDGIPDTIDKCPNRAGLSLYSGCPDTDGDGIDDSRDACPEEAGIPANAGCPQGRTVDVTSEEADFDGDGVIDRDDRCPRSPGLAVYNGCPDTDGDGIDDSRDRCPNTAGPVDLGGCPEIAPSDRRVLEIAMRSVQFESAKAEIKSESFNILTQIAEIMFRYPDFNLSIEGHTDDVGDAAENQRLSEVRARACYNFLISSGVAPERMNYAGYGESRPIATNQTISGRTLNRRVEFGLIPRN